MPKENGRVKSTVNLQSIFKTSPKGTEDKPKEEKVVTTPDRPLVDEELKAAMDKFAESRKHQAAEYQLLRREFTLESNRVTISLTNSIEEPLLQNIRIQLTTHLRESLNNNSISVIGVLIEHGAKKVVYTNKEKFDHLALKNPALLELKERLGLDTDF